MSTTARHTFIAGVAIALVTLVASACSGLMGKRAGPTRTRASEPAALSDIYQTERLEGEPLMRVRLGTGLTSLAVGGPGRVTLTPPGREPEVMILSTPFTISRSAEAGWTVASAAQTVSIPGFPEEVSRVVRSISVRPLGNELLTLDGAPIPGDLVVVPTENSGSTFDAVEHVPIEQYLPGVIAKELYPSWGLETFKAQAIAARSYALHERARRRSIGSYFDVVSTTQDQAYAGATRHEFAHKAVRETAGLVLTWSGSILRTYYSSTVGGRAASASDTWPIGAGFEYNLADPIQATPRNTEDELSPRNRWTVERSAADVSARLRAFGTSRSSSVRNIKTVRTIEVIERNAFDRPVRFRVKDSAGQAYTFRAEDLRVALNTPAPRYKKIDAKTRVYSSDFRVSIVGPEITINGRGFGHGVGMSQFGAEALSREGWSAERILMYYYPGAALERAY